MASRETFFAILQRVKQANPLFATLDARGLELLADAAMDVSFQPETRIIKQGHSSKTFYIIVSGSVRVVTEGKQLETEIARLSAGTFFGEMGILNDEPRTASVIAMDEVRCLAIDKPALLSVLEQYPKILHALGSVSVQRAGHLADVQASDINLDD